jgi:hypothetical protein
MTDKITPPSARTPASPPAIRVTDVTGAIRATGTIRATRTIRTIRAIRVASAIRATGVTDRPRHPRHRLQQRARGGTSSPPHLRPPRRGT